jgi:hypothetical protein
MNRVSGFQAVVIMLLLTSAVCAQLQELVAAEKTALGSDIIGHKNGDVFIITGGTLSGDLSGLSVVIEPGSSVTIGPTMKGTVVVREGSVTIAGVSATGTGTCDRKGCTFLKGSTTSTGTPVQGAFTIKNDKPESAGKIDILTSATVGHVTLSKVKDLEATDTGFRCTVDGGSIIDGTAFNNRAIVEFSPDSRQLDVFRPRDKPTDYIVKIDHLADGATIKSHDVRIIRFREDKSPVRELYSGDITKESGTHFVCGPDTKFKNDQNVNLIVKRTTSYVAGPSLPSDVGSDYIWSDIDTSTGSFSLEIKTKPGAKIAVDLQDNNPYRSIRANTVGSVVLFVENKASVSIDENGQLALVGGRQKKLESAYESVVGDHTDLLTKQQLTRCENSACKTASYTPSKNMPVTPTSETAVIPTPINPPAFPVPSNTAPTPVEPTSPPTSSSNPADDVRAEVVQLPPLTPESSPTDPVRAEIVPLPTLKLEPSPKSPTDPTPAPSVRAPDAAAAPPMADSTPRQASSDPTIDDLRSNSFVDSIGTIVTYAYSGSRNVYGTDRYGQEARTFTYDFENSEAGGRVKASGYTLIEPNEYQGPNSYIVTKRTTDTGWPFHVHVEDMGQKHQGPSDADMLIAEPNGNIVVSIDRDRQTFKSVGTYSIYFYTKDKKEKIGTYRLR